MFAHLTEISNFDIFHADTGPSDPCLLQVLLLLRLLCPMMSNALSGNCFDHVCDLWKVLLLHPQLLGSYINIVM